MQLQKGWLHRGFGGRGDHKKSQQDPDEAQVHWAKHVEGSLHHVNDVLSDYADAHTGTPTEAADTVFTQASDAEF